MCRLALGSMAMSYTEMKGDCVAGPSTAGSASPLPAMVAIIPSAVTRRMRTLLESTMYRPPAPSRARAPGALSWADLAGPPSPLNPASTIPA